MSSIRSIAFAALVLVGCADSHETGDAGDGATRDDGENADAPTGDATVLDGGAVYDFGCSTWHPRFGHLGCTADDVAVCNAWGAELAGPGEYARVNAMEDRLPRGGCTCLVGNLCGYPGGNASCTCGGAGCNADEMCVSDTPGGPVRCQRDACLGSVAGADGGT